MTFVSDVAQRSKSAAENAATVDTVVTGGTVVNENGALPAAIAIADGIIVAVGAPAAKQGPDQNWQRICDRW